MSRGVLAVVGVTLVLVTAGFVWGIAPSDASGAAQQADRGGQTIQVSASGQAETTPDQAVVRVAVLARADDADVVRERLAENASNVTEALRNLGLEDDQIRTVAFSIDQEYRRDEGEREPAGFRGVQAYELTLSNVSRVGAVVDTAVSSGANRVDGVELTLSDERRREVRAEALRDAMANARADADVIAESANLTIVGVHTASTGDFDFRPVRAEALQADAGRARTEIETGPVTVTAQVSVVYDATG